MFGVTFSSCLPRSSLSLSLSLSASSPPTKKETKKCLVPGRNRNSDHAKSSDKQTVFLKLQSRALPLSYRDFLTLGRISPVVGFFERVFRGVFLTKLARVVQISNFQRYMKGSLWGRGGERLEKVGTRKEKKRKTSALEHFLFFRSPLLDGASDPRWSTRSRSLRVQIVRRYYISDSGSGEALMSGLLAAAAGNALRQIAQFSRRRSLFAAATCSSSSNNKPPPPPPTTVTLEVRAGTGGLDAALFAAELFRAYARHAASAGWEWHELRRLSGGGASSASGSSSSSSSSASSASSDGVKLAAATVTGRGVAEALKNEAGVHRVQRVPVTESGGRQHTSAATVAVLLEDGEGEGERDGKTLSPDEVRIDTMRSWGKGGQHANTTDSAVRAVHVPSGLAVSVRSGRSQHRNRARAVAELTRRIREAGEGAEARRRSQERRGQVGGGDRSEKVRTYNFSRGVVSDHRSGRKVNDVAAVMRGERLGELFLVDE